MIMLSNSLFKRVLLLVGMYGILLIFLLATNPHSLPIGWLLLPFIWLFAMLFLSFLFLFAYLGRGKRGKRYSKKTILLATLFAVLPTFILLLDSINQLTIRDTLIVAVFVVLVVFYASKISFVRDK